MARIGGWFAVRKNRSSHNSDERHFSRWVDERKSGISESTERYFIVGADVDLDVAVDEASGSVAIIDGRCGWSDSSPDHPWGSNAKILLDRFRKLGPDCLHNLTGNFAVVVIDTLSRRALLAVDRMGIRPLCYCETGMGDFVFASDATLVASHSGVGSSISNQAIYEYMFFHVVPSPLTIFDSVRKLEPAQAAVIDESGIRLQTYWQPEFSEMPRSRVIELQNAVVPEIRTAVSRCIPDSHSGAFLSGGLDSSTVCGVTNEFCDGKLAAYSIGFGQRGYDETGFARIAAKHFNFDLHEYFVTPADISRSVEDLVLLFDEPFGNSSVIPAYFCARLAKSDNKTQIFAGDGGDEIFAGNERYATQKLFEAYHSIPEQIRTRVIEPVFDNLTVDRLAYVRKAKRYVDQARLPMPTRLYTYNPLITRPLSEIFHSDFLGKISRRGPEMRARKRYEEAGQTVLLNRMLFYDWKFTLADNDLRKVSRTCESAGVSVCFPFLEENVVELSLKVPSSEKIKFGRLRHFYKNSVRDYLPRETIAKTKHGFGLPFGEWLKSSEHLASQFDGYFENVKRRKIFNANYIDELRLKHQHEHAAYYGNLLWVIAVLEIWLSARDVPKN